MHHRASVVFHGYNNTVFAWKLHNNNEYGPVKLRSQEYVNNNKVRQWWSVRTQDQQAAAASMRGC